MKYAVNLEDKLDCLEKLWHNKNPDRCRISVTAPKNPQNPYRELPPSNPEDLYHWYNDGEWILKRNLKRIEESYFGGDALPCIFPYFGTGGHGKYIAPESSFEYSPDTIWIHPVIEDLSRFDYSFNPRTNKVFQRELSIIKYLVSESKGRYFVGPPDNCGSYDALAQLRGNEELLMDFLDEPQPVKQAAEALVNILRESGDLIFDAIKDNCHGGSVHGWMNTFSKGKHMQLQCDLSVMLSTDLFREFIVEELKSSAQWLDNAIYHLDGVEQLRHLDTILSIPEINMIQWVQVAGQLPAVSYIKELRRIQAAGKGIVLALEKKHVKEILQGLSPAGLNLLVTDASSPQEADEIVAFAAKCNTKE